MANYNVYCLDKNGVPLFGMNGKPDFESGDVYVSVSQVLNVEGAGDFLNRWLLQTFGGSENPWGAYQDFMTNVSRVGTALHGFIESDLMGEEFKGVITDEMEPGILSYLTWKGQHDIEVVDTEKILFSRRMRVAGQRDARLKIDGKLYNIDLKTGTVQDKAFVQLAAYSMMGEEMGEDGSADYAVLGGRDSKSKVAQGGEMVLHTREDWFNGRMSRDDLKFYFACLRQIWFYKNMKSRKFEAVVKGMDKYVDSMLERFKDQFNVAVGPKFGEAMVAPRNKKTKNKKV